MKTVRFVDLGRQYLRLRTEILEKFDEISRSGDYILSREGAAFEQEFADYCGVPHAIGVGNGSDALLLSLLALGVGPGDEVVTVPNSFVASAWVIARTGARIVFCDTGEDMNMDPARLREAVTPKTKAVLPVHLTGRVADMDAILKVAREFNLRVVEDAAQAVGARRNGRRAGAFGDCAGFSLHPLKNLHVHGDGGVITTPDPDICAFLKKSRNHGLRNRDECEFWGMNSRLDEVQAAIARIKLPRLDEWNERFRTLAGRYRLGLEGVAGIPGEESGEEPVYHRFMIRHEQRDALQAHLAARGVETKVNYPIPLHLQPAAAGLGYREGDFPVAERLARTILSLPLYPELEEDDVDYVIETIKDFTRR